MTYASPQRFWESIGIDRGLSPGGIQYKPIPREVMTSFKVLYSAVTAATLATAGYNSDELESDDPRLLPALLPALLFDGDRHYLGGMLLFDDVFRFVPAAVLMEPPDDDAEREEIIQRAGEIKNAALDLSGLDPSEYMVRMAVGRNALSGARFAEALALAATGAGMALNALAEALADQAMEAAENNLAANPIPTPFISVTRAGEHWLLTTGIDNHRLPVGAILAGQSDEAIRMTHQVIEDYLTLFEDIDTDEAR